MDELDELPDELILALQHETGWTREEVIASERWYTPQLGRYTFRNRARNEAVDVSDETIYRLMPKPTERDLFIEIFEVTALAIHDHRKRAQREAEAFIRGLTRMV